MAGRLGVKGGKTKNFSVGRESGQESRRDRKISKGF